jgi:hypothetical protein
VLFIVGEVHKVVGPGHVGKYQMSLNIDWVLAGDLDIRSVSDVR